MVSASGPPNASTTTALTAGAYPPSEQDPCATAAPRPTAAGPPCAKRLRDSRRGIDTIVMDAAIGVFCLLSGLFLVIAPINPHPSSEAGSLTGGARVAAQWMGIGTGIWLIALAIATFAGNGDAALAIVMVGGVVYLVVAGVFMLGLLAGAIGHLGSDYRRETGVRADQRFPPRL